MNKVMLIGNVGRDPEVRYFEADQCVASFTLATTERGYVLPNGTSVPDRTNMQRSISIKGTRFISKDVFAIGLMMIRKGCVDLLLRYMLIILNGCLLLVR